MTRPSHEVLDRFFQHLEEDTPSAGPVPVDGVIDCSPHRRRVLVAAGAFTVVATVVAGVLLSRSDPRSTLRSGTSASVVSSDSVASTDETVASTDPTVPVTIAHVPEATAPVVVAERVRTADLPVRLPKLTLPPGPVTIVVPTSDGANVEVRVMENGQLCVGYVDESNSCSLPNEERGLRAFIGSYFPDSSTVEPAFFSLIILGPPDTTFRLLDRDDGSEVCSLKQSTSPDIGDAAVWTCRGPITDRSWDLEAVTNGHSLVAEVSRTLYDTLPLDELPEIGSVADPTDTGSFADWVSATRRGTDPEACAGLIAVGRNGVVIGYHRMGDPWCWPVEEASNIVDGDGNVIGRFDENGYPTLDRDPPAAKFTPLDRANVVLVGDNSPVEFPIDGSVYAVNTQTLPLTGLAVLNGYGWRSDLDIVSSFTPPDAVVVLSIGRNDCRDLVRDDGSTIAFDDPQWRSEYTARVSSVMDRLVASGHRIVWLGVGDATDADLSARLAVVRDATLAAASAHPTITYVDVRSLPIGPEHRTDGYHLDEEGSAILSNALATAIGPPDE